MTVITGNVNSVINTTQIKAFQHVIGLLGQINNEITWKMGYKLMCACIMEYLIDTACEWLHELLYN